MTREEAKALLESRRDLIKSDYPEIDDYREALDMAIKALEQEPIPDKIRAEIENMEIVYDKSPNYEDNRTDEEKAVDWFNLDKLLFLQIIDEYRAESEGKE